MTNREAKIARIAFSLGEQATNHFGPVQLRTDMDAAEHTRIIDVFQVWFDDDRPCRYALECLRTGRCPFDPVCNN